MIVTPTIRDLILDGKRIGEIRDFIAEGRQQYGMQTFDQHLTDLVSNGEVAYDVAVAASTRPADFELQMRTFRGSIAPRGSTAVQTPGSSPAAPTPSSGMDGIQSGRGFDFLNG